MKSKLGSFLVMLLLAPVAHANQVATSVTGFDKIDNANATDCTFVSQALNRDGTLAVGINSNSAEYVNTLVRIPANALPLANGFAFTDSRGMEARYEDGQLTVTRNRSGLDDTEYTKMMITVDANLTQATSASVEKSDGLFGLRTEASIECRF